VNDYAQIQYPIPTINMYQSKRSDAGSIVGVPSCAGLMKELYSHFIDLAK
jgi:hypothetical protein